MDIAIVLQQMVIIFILISIGMLLYRKKLLSETTSKQISGIIVNVTNPALLICSAFQNGPKVSLQGLGTALAVYLLIYALLITASFLIPRILRVPDMYHYAYQMLTIFGNVGFIGIPLASAVLGAQSLIFVSIYNLIFNILIYTFGISLLRKAEAKQLAAQAASRKEDTTPACDATVHDDANAYVCTDKKQTTRTKEPHNRLQKLVNAGTISAAATIIFYLGDFKVPVIVSSTLSYMGQATTLLSMLVLGVSVAQMTLKDIFSHPKLYGFTLLRQILLPVGCILLLRPMVQDTLILNTMALMLAVPAANMPLMLCKQLHVDTDTISQGIILTTILSLVTIPVVSFFL